MDGHRSAAGGNGRAGNGYPERCPDCIEGLAVVIRRCLRELVAGAEPPREVWEHILARLRGPSLVGHGTPSGPCSGPR